jgi:hopanoid biosynthesis associated RND transporter like protein HpnN
MTGPLTRWLTAALTHAKLVVLVCIMLGISGASLFFFQGRLNADLGQLIQPKGDQDWYQSNKAFEAAFPIYRQTAVVVIRSRDAVAAENATQLLKAAFEAQGAFDQVFAPAVEPFIQTHRLYFLAPSDLDKWLLGTEFNFGVLQRLSEQPTLAATLLIIADMLGVQSGQPMPITLQHSIDGLLKGKPKVTSFYPLLPSEQTEVFNLIIVNGRQSLNEPLPNQQIVRALQSIINQQVLPESVAVELTGEVVLAHEEISAALNGIEIAGLASILILGVILLVGIGDVRIITAIFLVLLTGVGLTLGYATLAVGSFNTLSMLFVVMFFGLGVDFATHLALRLQADQATNADSMITAIHDMAPALALCTLTSAIAFLSFTPTAYTGMAELGIISAGGMVIALLLTLLMIPALLTLWPSLKTPPPLTFLSVKWLPKYQTPLTLILLAVMPGALYFASHLEFNYSVLSMRDADSPGMKALTRLQESGQQTDYSVILLADTAKEASRLKTRLTALESVASVQIPADVIPTAQADKYQRIMAVAELYRDLWTPPELDEQTLTLSSAREYLEAQMPSLKGQRLLIAQQIATFAKTLETDPANLALFDASLAQQLHRSNQDLMDLLEATPFTFSALPKPFQERLISPQGQHLVSVQPRVALTDKAKTDRFINDIRSVEPRIAGRSAVEWGIGEVVVNAFREAIVLTLCGVMICLILYFRNFLTACLVLVPIAFTLILTFAVSSFLALSLNMANILVVPLIIGLGVDSGIHVTHRFFKGGALKHQRATRRAVLISGLTTLGTFFSLILSPHQGAASIGLLLTVAIAWLLLLSLFLLPSLLSFFSQRGLLPARAV